MTRVVAALVTLLAAWLGLVNAGPAFGEPTCPVQAFAYDGDHHAAAPTTTTTERGSSTCTHDTHPAFAEYAGVAATTARKDQRSDPDLPSLVQPQVAAKSSTSLIGKSYGLGTVVESPGLTIQGFRGAKNSSHALNQIINRGVSPSMLRNTVADPKVVLRQGSGNYLHLSDVAAVVLRPDGQVVTAYGRADFRQHIFDILADVG